MSECPCCQPPDYASHYTNYIEEQLNGYDETNGRFGEVSIQICKLCGAKWLRYFVEYEAFSKSGRWYKGIISDAVSKSVTPQNAASILEGLDWWIRGGSFFDGTIQKGHGRLQLGIYGYEQGL